MTAESISGGKQAFFPKMFNSFTKPKATQILVIYEYEFLCLAIAIASQSPQKSISGFIETGSV